MQHPTDDELRQRRNPSEDHFTERKSIGDHKDWLRTIVAFANSTPLEKYAVLFIGVRDDGAIEANVATEAAQHKLARLVADAYPPIEYTTRALHESGQQYLCVVVTGSSQRPHFAGPAFVRVGAQTVRASAQQFERLIAERSSKTYRILQSHDKVVETRMIRRERAEMLGRIKSSSITTVVDCTTSTLTLRDQYGGTHQYSLDRVDVLESHDMPQTITLEIRE
jgi:predicted HTH transcriptional regulator